MQMQKGEKVNNRMKITPKLIRIIIIIVASITSGNLYIRQYWSKNNNR